MNEMNDFKGHIDQKFGHLTYSQHGEDLFILNLCHLLGLKKASYLDLGAHHPVNISNTALLYQQGSRGINVEANPNLIDVFERERPEDRNVCVGIDIKRGRVPFYMLDDTSGLNSLKPSSLILHGVQHVKEIVINVVTIDDIVSVYCKGIYPDLLFTDLEGLDLEVLHMANFDQSRPKIICSEIRKHEDYDANNILTQKGFLKYCRIMSNVIYVQTDLFRKLL
jgi:FkbM family methyltransferase